MTKRPRNSFALKGWAATLIAGIFVLVGKDTDKMYFLVAYMPIPRNFLLFRQNNAMIKVNNAERDFKLDFFSRVLEIFRLQHFRKLFRHIIYGNIKTRYNVFRKYANDVFGEYDFMVQKLPKSYIIRLFGKASRSEALPKHLLQRDDGSDRRR